MKKEYSTYGKHEIVDLWGIKPELLDNLPYLKQLGKFAIAKSGANYIDMVVKKFEPVGCTLLFLLSESHLSFHMSPESGYAAIDCFTCNSETKPEDAIEYIIKELKPDSNRIYRQTIVRGVE